MSEPRPPARPDVAAWRWAAWFAALVALTLAMVALRATLDKAHVTLGFLLVVLGASAAEGRALGLSIAGAAFLAFNYFFLPPYATLAVTNPLDWLVLLAFLVTSVVAAQLLYRANATALAATARAEEVDRLASLGAETLSAPGAAEALHAIVSTIRSSLDVAVCEVYRRGAEGRLLRAAVDVASTDHGDVTTGDPPPPEGARIVVAGTTVEAQSLVGWLASTGRSAVELLDGTVRLAPEEHADDGGPVERLASVRFAVHSYAALDVRAVLLPLLVREQTVGVLRIASPDGVTLTSAQARVLLALTHYASLGVERMRLVETAERAEAERRMESLRGALLTAVSHDLRTPLTTIKAIAHEIVHGADPQRAAVIGAEADLMDGLVADLLDLSRIQAGAVRPALAVNTVDELIEAALRRAAGTLETHPVQVELPDDALLTARFDVTQSVRVLVNLLENAAKYAPRGSAVVVRASRVGDRVRVAVCDAGPGVPATERDRIFEPFYRPPDVPPDVRGTGLGLSIARGLAEAQDGTVRYDDGAGGGSVFTLELPAVDVSLADVSLADEVPGDADIPGSPSVGAVAVEDEGAAPPAGGAAAVAPRPGHRVTA